jgi:hypothetical protein
VNVDSELAKKERKVLLDLALETDAKLVTAGRRCLVCGGHGAVSVLEGTRLIAHGTVERYVPDNS